MNDGRRKEYQQLEMGRAHRRRHEPCIVPSLHLLRCLVVGAVVAPIAVPLQGSLSALTGDNGPEFRRKSRPAARS